MVIYEGCDFTYRFESSIPHSLYETCPCHIIQDAIFKNHAVIIDNIRDAIRISPEPSIRDTLTNLGLI